MNYLKIERDEVSYREKMQNDIIKDVQVILGHESDKKEQIEEFLEAEYGY